MQVGALTSSMLSQKVHIPGVIEYDLKINHMDFTVSVWFRTEVNSVVTANIPQDHVDNYQTSPAHLYLYALRHGKVVSANEKGSTPPLIDSFDSKDQFKAFLGGPRNGEVVLCDLDVFSYTEAIPQTSIYSDLDTIKVEAVVYFLESLYVFKKYGGGSKCSAYRHSSVPTEKFHELFLSALEEFPILRAIPFYNPFWKESL